MRARANSRRQLANILRLFVRTNGLRMLLGTLLATLTVLAGMALLGLSGWFITATALAGLSAGAGLAFNVFVPSAGIRLLALGRTAGRYAERVVTHDATFAVLAALRERLFRGWAQPQAAQALLRQPARLLFRLTQDIDALESVYLRVFVPSVTSICALVLTGAVLGALDWRLGSVVFGWLLLGGGGVTIMAARRARAVSLRRSLNLERLRAQSVDLVAGQTELAMSGQLQWQCRAIARTDARMAQADDRLHRIETGSSWLLAVCGHLGVSAVLLAVGALVRAEALSVPLAALALLMVLAALEPFSSLRRGALDAGRSWLAVRRLGPRLNQVQRAPEFSTLAPLGGSGEGAAVARLVTAETYYRRSDGPALRAIDLHISPGECLAVIGPSGAGKSTLLQLIAGEIYAHRGTVQAQGCTWLTQRTELFQDSLRDNLRLAAPDAADDQLWAALQASGLVGDVRKFAHGLDTRLGEGGLGLSGGQSRRLALARLLLHPADFWLLDEPSESLDGPTAEDVLTRLVRNARSKTVLIATHLRREAQLADRLIVMNHGRMVAQHQRGTPDFEAALAALRQH